MITAEASCPNVKDLFDPILFKELTPLVVKEVPPRVVYVPARLKLAPTTFKGEIGSGRVSETELFVKLPAVTNDQYSVLLIEVKVPSGVPVTLPVNASAVAVTEPVPVVGLTSENGR